MKKKLDRDDKERLSQLPAKSRIDEFEGPKSSKKISKIDHLRSSDDFSPAKNLKTSGM